MQNEVAQCVRLVEVGAASNPVLEGSSNQVLAGKVKQSSDGGKSQVIKSQMRRLINKKS